METELGRKRKEKSEVEREQEKLLVAMRLGETPVLIPNTKVKP